MLDVLIAALIGATSVAGVDLAKDQIFGSSEDRMLSAIGASRTDPMPAKCERRLFLIEDGTLEWATLAKFDKCAVAIVLGTKGRPAIIGTLDIEPGAEFARERVAHGLWKVTTPPDGIALHWTVASGLWPARLKGEIIDEPLIPLPPRKPARDAYAPGQLWLEGAAEREPSSGNSSYTDINKKNKIYIEQGKEVAAPKAALAVAVAATALAGMAAWVLAAASAHGKLPLRRARSRRLSGKWLAAIAALATGAVGHTLDWEIDRVLEALR